MLISLETERMTLERKVKYWMKASSKALTLAMGINLCVTVFTLKKFKNCDEHLGHNLTSSNV